MRPLSSLTRRSYVQPPVADHQRWLRGLLGETMAELGVPGGVAVTVERGETGTPVCLGVSDVDGWRPVKPDTVFNVGALARTFSAIAVLRLVEAGTIAFDAPVPGDRAANVRDLVTHRRPDNVVAARRWVRSRVRLQADGSSAEPGNGALDRRWAPDLVDLSAAVAAAAGMPFARVIEEQVFAPVGMTSSFVGRPSPAGPSVAVGHRVRPSRPKRLGRGATPTDFFSNAPDLARFLSQLGGPAYRPLLTTGPGDDLPAPGLGFWLAERAGHLTVGQVGGVSGFVAGMACVPALGAGVAILLNGNSATESSVALVLNEVVSEALGRVAGLAAAPAVSRPRTASVRLVASI